jgi:hypothetical protein
VLLRRISAGPLPFAGIWRHLTTWNVFEFKGPTVSPRCGDIDLLFELGLGIQRRLNEERAKQGQPTVGADEVSFWYLANRLGRRFLREGRRSLGALEPCGPGVWRCVLLGRAVYLVSGTELPVEQDSLPMHIIGKEPRETERLVAALVVQQPGLLETYGGFLAVLHPEAWKEVEGMAKTKRKGFDFDLEPLFEAVGLKRVIEAAGLDRVIATVGIKRIIQEKGVEWLLAQMSPEQRRELKEHLK